MSSSHDSSPISSSDAHSPKSSGAKGRPRGSHGDSLIKRSREVLGLNRVAGMQRRKRSDKDDGDSAPATRREQVLEAQRAHRLRTKLYIKELESEVLRLRKSEAAAEAKAEALEKRTQFLLAQLSAHGLQVPAEFTLGVSNASDGPSTAGLSSFDNLQMQDPPSLPTTQALVPQEPVQLLRDNGDLAVVPSLFLQNGRLPDAVQTTQPATPFNFDDSQAELDFILTLERPCMAHLHQSHFNPHAPPFDAQQFFAPGSHPVGKTEDEPEAVISGHVLTASMPLWRKIQQDGHATTSASPDARRAELSTLLNSSFRLGLRGEIAPVQILEILKFRALSTAITVSQLQLLAGELQQHLKCYGFGAVFDEDKVRELVIKYC